MTQISVAVQAIDAALADAEAALGAAEKERGKLVEQVKSLRKARALLLGERPKGRKRNGTSDKAGVGNVTLVTDLLAEVRKASQAEITRQSGKNSGVVSAALRAAEEQGLVRDTGERVGRSRVFEIVGAGASAD